MNEKMLRFGLPFIVKNCLLMEDVFGFLVWVIFYGWYICKFKKNSVVKVHMEIFLWDCIEK